MSQNDIESLREIYAAAGSQGWEVEMFNVTCQAAGMGSRDVRKYVSSYASSTLSNSVPSDMPNNITPAAVEPLIEVISASTSFAAFVPPNNKDGNPCGNCSRWGKLCRHHQN